MPREIFVNILSIDVARGTPKAQMDKCAPCVLEPQDCGRQILVRDHGTEIVWCSFNVGPVKRVRPPLGTNGYDSVNNQA